ncbi:zinc ribbon domain-containing protein [Clostridium sp. SM-530-WT-3G]|uniref:zinc ribbon domain-containing protein n=1 Tax=Clostridium sp. SM-530-WT-3G TaxID=2725303 RepID=UPI00145E3E97|nr:zinc ribbon domain-containing protein [Clostridium sp. SM-530-WT-3G]NME84393.1 zinc ribbon domain-containing protein [Clostridium sp. SM-530-WT-3G]
MYCRNCGVKIDDDSKFCNICGEQVNIINNLGDTQEIIIPKVDFTYDNIYDDENEDYICEKSNLDTKEIRAVKDFIKKYSSRIILILSGIIIGVIITIATVKLSMGLEKTSSSSELTNKSNNIELADTQKQTNEKIVSSSDESNISDNTSETEAKKEIDDKKDTNIKKESKVNAENNNPNNIPSDGQINYISDSLKDGNIKFAYPSFFNISDKTNEYINLKTNNSDASISITSSNNLPSGSKNAKEKYNSTIDKLKQENAEIGYKNLSKRESVVTWRKDGLVYYQCNRYDNKGTKCDSFVVSYPDSQEHYYYDIIQYIYDNFSTSSDLK